MKDIGKLLFIWLILWTPVLGREKNYSCIIFMLHTKICFLRKYNNNNDEIT